MAAMERFGATPGWDVVGVSRRPVQGIPGAQFVSVDLFDAEACKAAFAEMSDVTHLVYAALYEKPGLFQGWLDDEQIKRNGQMLRNLFEPFSDAAANLQHVSLLHGTKAYGLHHPSVDKSLIHNPLREREPRIDHPNFYWVQEDYLRERQQGADWGLSVFRPTVIYGDAPGNNMNPILAIGAYAAILRERGEPLHFPGTGRHEIREAVDAQLVADALLWAATTPAARNETFNLTNGDVFTWNGVWGAIAAEMAMEVGEDRPVSLASWLEAAGDEWSAIVQKYELLANPDVVAFAGANSIVYTDMVLGGPRGERGIPYLNSTIKGRQAGFTACMDTEDMFRDMIRRLQRRRMLPE